MKSFKNVRTRYCTGCRLPSGACQAEVSSLCGNESVGRILFKMGGVISFPSSRKGVARQVNGVQSGGQ